MKNNDSYNFNSINLIQFAFKNWKPLIIFPLIMFVASALISVFALKNRYESTFVFFPTAQTSISKTLLSAAGGYVDGIATIGDEEQAEHLLQVLNSGFIRSKIISKYDLLYHYRIRPDDKYKMTKLYKLYKKNINFKRTEFMSIKISVMDEDPQTAADIANDIGALLDSAMNQILKERAIKAFEIVKNEYFSLFNYVRSLEDSLVSLGQLGIYEPEMQAQALSDAYSKAIVEGDARAIKKLKSELDILSKYGSLYLSTMSSLAHNKTNLGDLKEKYTEAKVEAEQNIPYKFVVDRAFRAEKKAYPKRSLIVFFSTITTFILTLIGLLIIENIKEFNKA